MIELPATADMARLSRLMDGVLRAQVIDNRSEARLCGDPELVELCGGDKPADFVAAIEHASGLPYYDAMAIMIDSIPVERVEVRRPSVRRKRKMISLASALKEATKAGLHVNGAVIEDGKIELKFGSLDANDAGTIINTPEQLRRLI